MAAADLDFVANIHVGRCPIQTTPLASSRAGSTKKARPSFDATVGIAGEAADLPLRCVSSASTQVPISRGPSPDFPYSRSPGPNLPLADKPPGVAHNSYVVRPAAGSHLENPGTGEPHAHKAQRPATAPTDKSRVAQPRAAVGAQLLKQELQKQPQQQLQQQLQQQMQPRAPAGRPSGLQQRPGTAPPRGPATAPGCCAPHRRPQWPVPEARAQVTTAGSCLVGCVDPERGLHHARCPNNPNSQAYALAAAATAAARAPTSPMLASPAAAARAVTRPPEGAGVAAAEATVAEEVAPLGACSSFYDTWSPSRRLRSQPPASARGSQPPASARGPGPRPEPLHGAPRPPLLSALAAHSAADPPPGLLSAVLHALRRKAWSPEAFLQAREELLMSGRPDLLHVLTRAVREATERATVDLAYRLPGDGLMWQQERRKDLHGVMMDVPEVQWFGRRNIGVAFEMSYSMRARSITLTQACPLDIVRELREKVGFKGPIVVVAEASSFDEDGGVDLSAPGGGLWPEELTLRTDAGRFLTAAADQAKRCHHEATIRQHLTDRCDPYILRLARVTLMRGSNEEGYPFLEEPHQFTVLTTANSNPRPAVRSVKFRKRPPMEWYRNSEENAALAERLNLLGEVARMEQTFLDQADGVLPRADSDDEAGNDEASQFRAPPVFIFGMPGCSEAIRHPRDAVANAVKHWRRQFSSSFHQVFMCCRGRGGGDPELANHAGTIANRDMDAEYLAQALGDPTVHTDASEEEQDDDDDDEDALSFPQRSPLSVGSSSRPGTRSSQYVLNSVPSFQSDVLEAASALAANSDKVSNAGLDAPLMKAKLNSRTLRQQAMKPLGESLEERGGVDGEEEAGDDLQVPLTFSYGVPSSGTTLRFEPERTSGLVSTYAALQLSNPIRGTNPRFDLEKQVHTPTSALYAEELEGDLIRKCESLDEPVSKHVGDAVEARRRLSVHASSVVATRKKKASTIDEGEKHQWKAAQKTLADYGLFLGDSLDPHMKPTMSRRASAVAKLQSSPPPRRTSCGGRLRTQSESPGRNSVFDVSAGLPGGRVHRSRSCEIQDRAAFKTYTDWAQHMDDMVQDMRQSHWVAQQSLRDRGRRMCAKMEILKRTMPLPNSHNTKKALGTTDLVLGFAASAGNCSSGFYKPPWGTKLGHKERLKQLREEVFHETRARLRRHRLDAEDADKGLARANTMVASELKRSISANNEGSEDSVRESCQRRSTELVPGGGGGSRQTAQPFARGTTAGGSGGASGGDDGLSPRSRLLGPGGRPAREATIAKKALAAAFSREDSLLAGLPSVAAETLARRGSMLEKSVHIVDHSHDGDNPATSGVPWTDPSSSLRRMITMPEQIEDTEHTPAFHDQCSQTRDHRVSFAVGLGGSSSGAASACDGDHSHRSSGAGLGGGGELRRPSTAKPERKSFMRKSIQEAFGIGVGRLSSAAESDAEEKITALEGQIQSLAASLEGAQKKRATISHHPAGPAGVAMRTTTRRSVAAPPPPWSI